MNFKEKGTQKVIKPDRNFSPKYEVTHAKMLIVLLQKGPFLY
jgi:hypothetical protein